MFCGSALQGLVLISILPSIVHGTVYQAVLDHVCQKAPGDNCVRSTYALQVTLEVGAGDTKSIFISSGHPINDSCFSLLQRIATKSFLPNGNKIEYVDLQFDLVPTYDVSKGAAADPTLKIDSTSKPEVILGPNGGIIINGVKLVDLNSSPVPLLSSSGTHINGIRLADSISMKVDTNSGPPKLTRGASFLKILKIGSKNG